jgi:hypothetical protein
MIRVLKPLRCAARTGRGRADRPGRPRGAWFIGLEGFNSSSEKEDSGISDRSKRGYRKYQTWVETGKCGE